MVSRKGQSFSFSFYMQRCDRNKIGNWKQEISRPKAMLIQRWFAGAAKDGARRSTWTQLGSKAPNPNVVHTVFVVHRMHTRNSDIPSDKLFTVTNPESHDANPKIVVLSVHPDHHRKQRKVEDRDRLEKKRKRSDQKKESARFEHPCISTTQNIPLLIL